MRGEGAIGTELRVCERDEVHHVAHTLKSRSVELIEEEDFVTDGAMCLDRIERCGLL